MPTRPTIAASVCLALLAAGTVWWAQQSDKVPAEARRAPANAQIASAPATAARPFFAPVDTPRPAPAKPAPRWRELRDQYIHATSLRAFFYEAIKRPQDGGYIYAADALFGCNKEPPAPASERQREAIQAWRNRCDFTPQDLEDAWRSFEGIRNFDFNDDPLMARTFAIGRVYLGKEAAAIVAATIDEGIPGQIASVVYPAMEALATKTASGPKTAAPAWLEQAPLLLACRLGAKCGPGTPATMDLCVMHDWCADNVNDALRAGLGADYARADQLAAQMADAVRRRDLARLVPPR